MSHATSLLFLALTVSSNAFAQTFIVSGTVRDSATGDPMVAVNIRLAGTSRGTISNANGFYRMDVERGRRMVVFTLVGYRPDTLRTDVDGPLSYNPVLAQAPIQMAEVEVTGEDPAVAIMRRVIANKKAWSERLHSYQLEAFTRLTMKRDTAIAMMMESYTTGYWRMGDTLREVVRQKRQTQNIPGAENFAAVGRILNFYDDEIQFSGYRFVGPTSPDAFDYYDFRLEKTRLRGDVPAYTIGLHPRSRVTPLFRGTITVAGDSYALSGVDVSPNEAFSIPFLSDLDLHYSQQFGLYEEKFWMPVDIRVSGQFSINIVGITLPAIGMEQNSVIYDYAVNPELPDSVFGKPRLTSLAEASVFDSSFWKKQDVLPLTIEEKTAYATLDSTQTLERQFRPSGPLAVLASASSSFLGYLKMRFNRVEGLMLGLQGRLDTVTHQVALFGSAGYGFSDRKEKVRGGAELFFDSGRRYRIGVEGFRDAENIPDEGYYDDAAILFGTLLSKRDYRDYYYANGWRLWVGAKPVNRLSLQVGLRSAHEQSAPVRTNYSLLEPDRLYRQNPSVDDGWMRSLTLNAAYGDDPVPLGLVARNAVEVEAEYAPPGFLGSQFNFTRVTGRAELHVKTYGARLLFAPVLSLKLTGGIAWGAVPPQRIFSLESRYDGFGPFGVLRGGEIKEFTGTRFVALSLEHNFRSTPFLLLDIPFLYKQGIEVLVHGTTARTWSRAPLPFGAPTNGWYHEAGFGFSRILGILRLDYTYRFASPAGSYLSLGVAQIL